MGTGVPALDVFCNPPKLKDNLGSSSELKSCGFGKGNNNSLTPKRVRPTPTFAACAAKLPPKKPIP